VIQDEAFIFESKKDFKSFGISSIDNSGFYFFDEKIKDFENNEFDKYIILLRF
jgi:hypothetical protein